MAVGGPIQIGIRHHLNRECRALRESAERSRPVPGENKRRFSSRRWRAGRELAREHLDATDPFRDDAENGHDTARHQRPPPAARQHPFSHTQDAASRVAESGIREYCRSAAGSRRRLRRRLPGIEASSGRSRAPSVRGPHELASRAEARRGPENTGSWLRSEFRYWRYASRPVSTPRLLELYVRPWPGREASSHWSRTIRGSLGVL